MLAVSVVLAIMLSVIAFIMFFKDLTAIFVLCSLYVSVSLLLQEVA